MKCLFLSKENIWSYKLFQKCKEIENYDFIWVNQGLYQIKNFTGLILDEINNASIKPEYIFFFHWSDKIHEKIYENSNCISFHTSNLPEGRGGNPIQNQILEGISQTYVNAIKTSGQIDGGDLYCRETISLQGSLQDIWLKIAEVSYKMIESILFNDLKPTPQSNLDLKKYKRLNSNEMNLNGDDAIEKLYDQIRMRDADGYGKSFIMVDGFKFEFSRAQMTGQDIVSDVKISKV